MNNTHISDINEETTKPNNKTSTLKLKTLLAKKDLKQVVKKTGPPRKSKLGAAAVAHNPFTDKN